jgi:WD40 repeat protein
MKYYQIDFFYFICFILVNAWSLAFSPDGQYIATGSFGGKVDLYNSESGQKEMTLDTQTKFVLSAIYVKKILFYKTKKRRNMFFIIFRVLMESYLHVVHKMVS